MRNKFIGLVILLIGSEALGIIFGSIFFRLFNHTVPPAVLTSFNKGTAQAAFLLYGAGFGLAIFLWAIVAIAGSAAFRIGKRQATRGNP